MNIQRLEELESKSLRFIESIAKASKVPLFSGNSGGKDSAVMEYLLQKSGIVYTSEYGNTTIDPPGTIPYIKRVHPHTKIIQPEKSFYQLVQMKGLPTMQKRFCCQNLKEYIGIGKDIFLGVRSAEGTKRKGRDYFQCDLRHKDTHQIYPIYDWQDFDIWDFIEWKGLELAPAYACGLTRLGCVGCPLATPDKRKHEFELYPKYYTATEKAIRIGMQNNPQWLISIITEGDAALAMKWWMSGLSIKEYYAYNYVFEGKREGKHIKWAITPRVRFFTIKP